MQDGTISKPNEPESASITINRWPIIVGALALTLSMVPYLVGLALSNGRHFMWLGYNLDDSCVYLSWLRQAADGSHRVLNMFTTEAQHGREANPLFLVLGLTSRVFHLPILFVLHASRLLFGAWLLAIVWQIIVRSTDNERARKVAFLFVCFGSGLGWIPGIWPAPGPIDNWQPEAITFLSLYLSPLFCFSLALQALSVLQFVNAVDTGQIKYAIKAGLAVFLLGLTHTYDVITMLSVFGLFAAVSTVFRTTDRAARVWLYAAAVGIISAPSVLYIYHELQTENVFHLRMEVRTASGPVWQLVMGYGALLVGAIYGAMPIIRAVARKAAGRQSNPTTDNDVSQSTLRPHALMLVVWMVANIAVAYLPVKQFPFQRKMLQGAHIPIAILAGFGAAHLMERVRALDLQWRFLAAAAAFTIVFSLSNVVFMVRDVSSFEEDLIQTTHMHRPYINSGEMDAFHWIEDNTPPGTAIQPIPWLSLSGPHYGPSDVTLACFAPGLTNRPVYCGHWGETPDYPAKLSEIDRIGLPAPMMTDEARIMLLRKMKVKYLIFSQKQPEETTLGADADKLLPIFRGDVPLPDYLVKVYSNPDADVYRVQLP